MAGGVRPGPFAEQHGSGMGAVLLGFLGDVDAGAVGVQRLADAAHDRGHGGFDRGLVEQFQGRETDRVEHGPAGAAAVGLGGGGGGVGVFEHDEGGVRVDARIAHDHVGRGAVAGSDGPQHGGGFAARHGRSVADGWAGIESGRRVS